MSTQTMIDVGQSVAILFLSVAVFLLNMNRRRP